MEIGAKIKALRRKLDLTQEELAARTELTKGYISQLENELASPSIATLVDILNVLGSDLKSFFTEEKSQKIVFNKKDFFESNSGDGLATWLIPNSQKHDMEPILLTLPPGGVSQERPPFEGEECGYVLKGTVRIYTSEKVYEEAKKGSAFYINGAKDHVIKNEGSSEAVIIWIATPSNF